MPRLVSFHICKASRRSSKFRQPVADLCLSPFFLPRPPCALLFSVLFFLLLFFVLFSLLSVLRFFFLVPTCARFAFRFMSRRKLTEKEQEKSETSPIFVFGICYFVSSSLSLLRRIFSVCACDERRFSLVKERERERDRLFSECLTATSLITSGLDSCGYGQESPGETRDLRRRAWEASLEFQSSAFS